MSISRQLAAELKAKAIKDRIGELSDIWNGTFEVSRETLPSDLKIATVACASKILDKLNAKLKPAEFMEAATSDRNVALAINEIVAPAKKDEPPKAGRPGVSRFEPKSFRHGVLGTHVPKATNPVVDMPIVADMGPSRGVAIPFLSGSVPSARRQFGSATTNPAGDSKKIRFLGLSITFEGRTMTMADWLKDEDRTFLDGLVAIGWPSIWLEATTRLIDAGLRGLERIEKVDPNLKTVHFLLPDGGYVMLSPLTSAPLWTEMHARIHRIPLPGAPQAEEPTVRKSYETQRRMVGGSNPQNISFETPMLHSRYQLLKSFPPQVRKPPNLLRITARLAATGTTIGDRRLSKRLSDLLAGHVAPTSRRNKQWELRLERLLASAALQFLRDAFSFGEAIDAGHPTEAALAIRDTAERALVLHGFSSLDDEDAESLVTRFAGFMSSGQSGIPWFAGDGARKPLRKAIEAAERGEAVVVPREENEGAPPPVARAPDNIRAARARN